MNAGGLKTYCLSRLTKSKYSLTLIKCTWQRFGRHTFMRLGDCREDGEIGAPETDGRGNQGILRGDQQLENRGREASVREAVQLTSRQRARMADLSLLLEVILKTTATR